MRPPRLLLVAPLLALVAAAPAPAATYCVVDPACPADAIAKPDLASAAAAAGPDAAPDLIRVGPGRFDAGAGLRLVGGDVLAGTGSGATTVAGPVELATGALRDLTVELTPGQATGVTAQGGTLSGVAVDGTAASGIDAAGVRLAGGRFTGGSVDMAAGTGVVTQGTAAAIADSEVRAPTGVGVGTAGADVARVQIAATTGVRAVDGKARLDAVTIRLEGFSTTGVLVGPGAGTVGPATLSHVTIAGSGASDSTGVAALAACDGQAAAVTIDSTAITGVGRALRRVAACTAAKQTPSSASLAVTRSAFDPGKVESSGPGNASVEAPVATAFMLADDLTPTDGSPLVDAGNPAEPAGLDVFGLPRPVDGDGDGTAVPDVGAVEVQYPPLDDSGYDYGDTGGYDYPADGDVAGDSQRSKRRRTARRPVVRVTGSKTHPRRFTIRVTVGHPRGTSPRGGTVALDAWAGRRHLGVRKAKADRKGRATFAFKLPRDVRRKRVGIKASFGGTKTLKPRSGRFVGLY